MFISATIASFTQNKPRLREHPKCFQLLQYCRARIIRLCQVGLLIDVLLKRFVGCFFKKNKEQSTVSQSHLGFSQRDWLIDSPSLRQMNCVCSLLRSDSVNFCSGRAAGQFTEPLPVHLLARGVQKAVEAIFVEWLQKTAFGTPAIHLYAARYFIRLQSPGGSAKPWPSVGLPSDFWRTTWWSLLLTDISASPKRPPQLLRSVCFCQRFRGLIRRNTGCRDT